MAGLIPLYLFLMGILFHLSAVSAEVVYQCDQFDPGDPLGSCDWQIIEIYDTQNMAAVGDPSSGQPEDIVLQAFYREGSYAGNPDDKGGFEFWSTPFAPGEDMTLSYEVYFSKGFDYVRGGKLPGFYGGTPSSCNSTYCERCSGTLRGDCFSTRFMWDRQGEGYVYAYLPSDEGFGREIGRNLFWFEPGRWISIAQRLRMNTAGMEDGLMSIFFDGEEIFTANDVKYREIKDVQINVLFFSTFFGGSSVPEFAATADCYSYYRNFVVTLNT